MYGHYRGKLCFFSFEKLQIKCNLLWMLLTFTLVLYYKAVWNTRLWFTIFIQNIFGKLLLKLHIWALLTVMVIVLWHITIKSTYILIPHPKQCAIMTRIAHKSAIKEQWKSPERFYLENDGTKGCFVLLGYLQVTCPWRRPHRRATSKSWQTGRWRLWM